MKQPEFLKKGDKVMIVSPAGKIDPKKITNAKKYLEHWDLDVFIGKHASEQYFQMAGSDEQRIEDFQNALDHPGIKAIFCSRGGYGLIRIIDKLSFAKFLKTPKWIIGFSDITILHQILNHKLGFQSIHAVMPNSYPDYPETNKSLQLLRRNLFGDVTETIVKPHPLNRKGQSEGIITGGNLSILFSLRGTPYDYDFSGKILFIEDLSEHHYHVDRMMINLKTGGKLKDLAGLVVGKFSSMSDSPKRFGKTIEEIIYEAVADYNYPVCFHYPAGHLIMNYPIVLGKEIKLTVSESDTRLSY